MVLLGLMRSIERASSPSSCALRRGRAGLAASLFALAIACAAPPSNAGFGVPASLPAVGPYRVGSGPGPTPAERYGALDRAACEAALGARGAVFRRVDEARGVLEPVRLDGPLHGVTYHSGLPASQRATSPYEIIDCRLALALDDFAEQLAAHDVVEVVHLSIYRPPPGSRAHAPPGPVAARDASPHTRALAIDAASFVKRDGTTLIVERDFHGRIGAPTCGAGAGPHPATPEALELRSIVCDAAAAKLFNVALTPDFNWKHRNHFHLEVRSDAKWFYLH
jgi:hypothetical protein